MKKNKVLRIIISCLFSLAMIIGMTSNSMTVSNAATGQLEYLGQARSGNSIVGKFKLNGTWAFCMEHPKATPGTQKVNTTVYTGTSAKAVMVRKLLYYGYEGVSPWSGFSGMSANEQIVVTSYALSQIYYGDDHSNVSAVTKFINYCKRQADPNTAWLHFAKTNLTSSYDSSKNIQVSETVVLNGFSMYSTTLKTNNSAITIHNVTTGSSGASVKVKGGDSIYLTAQASYTGDFNTGSIKVGKKYNALISKIKGYQTIGASYAHAPGESTFLKVSFKAVTGSLKLTKTDLGGNKIDGAQFRIWGNGYDATSNVSNGELTVSGLNAGTYSVQEVKAPDGYVLDSTVYTVDVNAGQESDKTISNKQTITRVSKTDVNGNFVAGATLNIIDSTNGSVVKEFTSGQSATEVDGLVQGRKYILRETKAPNGYTVAQDVDFTAGEDVSVSMTDTKAPKISKVDITGEKEVEGAEMKVTDKDGKTVDSWTSGKDSHEVEGLTNGETYTLTETTTPNGYITSKDVTFVAGKDETVKMIDKQELAYKTDVAGKEVEGAKIEVIDKETGKIVDSWTSDKDAHAINGMTDGKTYILKETSAPEGYIVSKQIEFVAGDESKVTMIDKQEAISKVDELGNRVAGAALTITDKDGKTVDSWTTTKESDHYASNLIDGDTYTLTETQNPMGYYKASAITFVAGDKTSISMLDQTIYTNIQVNKVDKQTGKAILSKDFEFSLYSDATCTQKIETVQGNKENGTATFEKLKYGTYYVKETKAPVGYGLSDEVKCIVIDDQLENVGHTYSFTYQDSIIPLSAKRIYHSNAVKTGDNTSVTLYVIVGLIALLSLLALILIRKQEKRYEE